MNDDGRHRFIVGLDYGTTYSGMSYVTSNSRSIDDIEVISDWPNWPHTVWKAPSKIAYASENRRMLDNQWGYAVPSGAQCYTWTKLLLDKDARPADYDDPTLHDVFGSGMLRLPPGKSAEAVCEDYLRGLHHYLMGVLRKRFGHDVVQMTPIECWISVPALWSDKATALTRQAAVAAGFASRAGDSVNIVREPEAAALTVLKPHLSSRAASPLKPGEDIMICDCGGGTVDITTYRIIACEPKLEFKELYVGDGGKCGSTYIDRNFNNWMVRNFGDAYTSLPLRRRGPGSDFMRSFEVAKRSFGTQMASSAVMDIEHIYMEAPDTILYDSDEGCVKLPRAEMERFFKPVIQQIINLIESQLRIARKSDKCSLNRLILVGGFGDSEYLNTELNKWCRENGHVGLTCPPQCQAAVVRGAALRGLEGIRPKFRRVRRHYGFSVAAPFRVGIDPPEKQYIPRWWNIPYCKDVMRWKLHKGEQVDENSEMSCTLNCTRLATDTTFDDVLMLYSCSRDEAPAYSDHYSVEIVGRIKVKFSARDVSTAESRWSPEHDCLMYRLSYTLLMKQNEGLLHFKALVDGEDRGSASISFT